MIFDAYLPPDNGLSLIALDLDGTHHNNQQHEHELNMMSI